MEPTVILSYEQFQERPSILQTQLRLSVRWRSLAIKFLGELSKCLTMGSLDD
jgi:hypothetical protein